ncbi:MAG: ion channel [Candidatus Kaiserbacteria bacterium]|nr:ion channel [Candidatus Kaiserbacteria bacterium]
MKRFAVALTYSRLFHVVSVVFDVVGITYFVWSFFFLAEPLVSFEILLGIFFAIEYVLLLFASEKWWRYIRHPLAISNALIIIGYLAAPFWNFGFLRVLRVFRVIQLYQIIPDIRMFTSRIVFWEKLFATFIHVCVLVFIITKVVFVLQANVNVDIETVFDAFYFTINAITKVGDGDSIALVGVQGKVLTLIIAFLSLSIFVQLLDTAREVQQIRLTRKKEQEKKAKRKGGAQRKKMEEIYTEHLCTYCDIKNRDKFASCK